LPGLITIKTLQTFRFLGNHPNFILKKGVLFGTGQSGYLSVIQRIMKRAINFTGNFQGRKRSPVSQNRKKKLKKT
jgi:hypothetical protein